MPLKVLHTAVSSTSGQHWLLCSLLSYTSPRYSFIFSHNSWLQTQSALKTPLLPYCPSAPLLLLTLICFAALLPFSLLLAVDQTAPTKPRVIKSPKALTIQELLLLHPFTVSNSIKWDKSEKTSSLMSVSVLTHLVNSVFTLTVHGDLWHKPQWELFLLAYQNI